MKTLFSLLALSVLSTPALAQDDPVMTKGRELTQLFYASRFDALWDKFSAPMKAQFGQAASLSAFRLQVKEQLGNEAKVVSEKTGKVLEYDVYSRVVQFDKVDLNLLVQWSFDNEGKVAGFLITPASEAPSKYLEYETKTKLRLPFTGAWDVFWGGRKIADNYHTTSVDQRFAYDILIMKDGKSHKGEGKSNEDYYCFGVPLYAPAAGTVIATANDVIDNVPGEMNPSQPLGNHVVIDHGNGEFSILAHFKQGTVKVKKGDKVTYETLLGECGNSGNSSEAHLHFHMQDGPTPFLAAGLPAPFQNYEADGKLVASGEPVRGQTVQRAKQQ